MTDLHKPMVEIEHLHKHFGPETAVEDFKNPESVGEGKR